MTTQVHDITDVKKSRLPKWATKKNAAKAAALAVFGTAVALVAYDKVTHRSEDNDTSDAETD